jgi:hypothetical protein
VAAAEEEEEEREEERVGGWVGVGLEVCVEGGGFSLCGGAVGAGG